MGMTLRHYVLAVGKPDCCQPIQCDDPVSPRHATTMTYLACPKCRHAPLPEDQSLPAACPACSLIPAKFSAIPVALQCTVTVAQTGDGTKTGAVGSKALTAAARTSATWDR